MGPVSNLARPQTAHTNEGSSPLPTYLVTHKIGAGRDLNFDGHVVFTHSFGAGVTVKALGSIGIVESERDFQLGNVGASVRLFGRDIILGGGGASVYLNAENTVYVGEGSIRPHSKTLLTHASTLPAVIESGPEVDGGYDWKGLGASCTVIAGEMAQIHSLGASCHVKAPMTII